MLGRSRRAERLNGRNNSRKASQCPLGHICDFPRKVLQILCFLIETKGQSSKQIPGLAAGISRGTLQRKNVPSRVLEHGTGYDMAGKRAASDALSLSGGRGGIGTVLSTKIITFVRVAVVKSAGKGNQEHQGCPILRSGSLQVAYLLIKNFGELIGTRYYRKCPDLLEDGNFVEYESYTSDQPKNAFRNMLHNGLAQSDRVIIRHCGLTDGYMIQQVEGQIRNGIPVSNIWVFNGQEVRLLLNTEG